MGLLGAVWVGVALRDASPVIAIPAALLGGVLAGAFWGFIPGVLKAMSGAHEVVTTIMLNYIALSVLAWAVNGPLRVAAAPAAITPIRRQRRPADPRRPQWTHRHPHRHPCGPGRGLDPVPHHLWLRGADRGRQSRGGPIRRHAAPNYHHRDDVDLRTARGPRPAPIEMLGLSHKTTSSYATNVGFDAIAVALLGRSSPIGVLLAALLFGIMRAGAGLMQIKAGIPVELVDVLQATILFFLVVNSVIRRWLRLSDVRPGMSASEKVTRVVGNEALP